MSKPTYLNPYQLLSVLSLSLAAGSVGATVQLPEARHAQLENFSAAVQPTQSRVLLQADTPQKQSGLIYAAHHSHVSHQSHASHASHQSSAH